jgi:hypothetical protein
MYRPVLDSRPCRTALWVHGVGLWGAAGSEPELPGTRKNRKGSRRSGRERRLIRRPGSAPVTRGDGREDGLDLGHDVGRRARE